jgi:hypothetical protein
MPPSASGIGPQRALEANTKAPRAKRESPSSPKLPQRAQDRSRGAPIRPAERDRSAASLGSEHQNPSRKARKPVLPRASSASAGPIPRSAPPTRTAEVPSRPRLGTVWGMRRSFRTLRLCAVPGVSPRAGIRCPVGALRTPHLPRASLASAGPIPRSTPYAQRSGIGPQRALEANTKNPSRKARKPHPPPSFLRERRTDPAERATNTHSGGFVTTTPWDGLGYRGRDGRCRPPLPPNRTGGFPASGSPVGESPACGGTGAIGTG